MFLVIKVNLPTIMMRFVDFLPPSFTIYISRDLVHVSSHQNNLDHEKIFEFQTEWHVKSLETVKERASVLRDKNFERGKSERGKVF